jgi:hypothetical protein
MRKIFGKRKGGTVVPEDWVDEGDATSLAKQ